MRDIIKALMEDIGYTDIHSQTNGRDALEWTKRNIPDLVITDWNMPQMNGITFLRHVKENDQTKHIPILMVTAEAKREQVIEAAQLGAAGYVVKPFDKETLKSKLEGIYAKKRG